MSDQERVSRAAEKLARTTRDSYQVMLDHVIGLQERNVRFAQSVVDDSIEEFRRQAESHQAMTREFVERAKEQREAYQTLINESVDAYLELLYAPFGDYKRNLKAVK